jgi:hypothetical protein
LTPCIFFYIFPQIMFLSICYSPFSFSDYYLRSHVFFKLLISPGRGRKSTRKNWLYLNWSCGTVVF